MSEPNTAEDEHFFALARYWEKKFDLILVERDTLAQQVEVLTLENKNLLAANCYSIDTEQQAMDEVRTLTVERDALKSTCERAFYAINGLIPQRPIRDLDETLSELGAAMKVAS